MRVLLINPPLQRLSEVKNAYFPIGLGYLAAVLRDRAFVKIYNADKGAEEKNFYPITTNFERIKRHQNYIDALKNDKHLVWREIKDTVQQFKPDLIGITAMTSTLPSAYKVAEICKQVNQEVPIVFGGPHPTIQPDKVIENENVDYVVVSEGERTIVELVEQLKSDNTLLQNINGLVFKMNGSVHFNPPQSFISNLDELPFPARDLVLRPELYTPSEMSALVTSRGCPYPCTYCSAKSIWTRKVRFRSIENVIKEMKEIKETYNNDGFVFDDDSFSVNKKRTMELCQQIIQAKLNTMWTCYSRVDLIDQELLEMMKKSGCIRISFGIESGSERVRDLMKKGITREQIFRAIELTRKNKIEVSTCFMVGLPYETKEDILETIKMVKELKPHFTNVCTFTPYPGSSLYDECVKQGLINDDIDWSYFSHHSPHNRFFKNIPEEDFRTLLNTLVMTADRYNNPMNFSTLARRGIAKWKVFLRHPTRIFNTPKTILLHKLNTKFRQLMGKSL